LFEHLLGSPESGSVLDDEGQEEDKPAANSNGCKDSDVEDWVFVGRWKLEVLSNERHIGMRQRMVVSSWVQVMEGGHWGLRDKFMLRGKER